MLFFVFINNSQTVSVSGLLFEYLNCFLALNVFFGPFLLAPPPAGFDLVNKVEFKLKQALKIAKL